MDKGIQLNITQKMHGTNSLIFVYEEDGVKKMKFGSRTREIRIGDDNFGFAAAMTERESEILTILPCGYHYGEWCGPGINSGEGLTKKKLFLFDFWREIDLSSVSDIIEYIPVLFSEKVGISRASDIIQVYFSLLSEDGSFAVKGFMRPEGIMVDIIGKKLKYVFNNESTSWRDKDHEYVKQKELRKQETKTMGEKFVQPLRLEKLLSRDEKYVRDYPSSTGAIIADYIQDLIDEGELEAHDRTAKRAASNCIANYIKEKFKII